MLQSVHSFLHLAIDQIGKVVVQAVTVLYVTTDNAHLADLSVSKHSSAKTSSELRRTLRQLQSAVETLQRTGDQTAPVCRRLESINSLVHRDTGKLHDAFMAACVQAMTWFDCLTIMMLCNLYYLTVEYRY